MFWNRQNVSISSIIKTQTCPVGEHLKVTPVCRYERDVSSDAGGPTPRADCPGCPPPQTSVALRPAAHLSSQQDVHVQTGDPGLCVGNSPPSAQANVVFQQVRGQNKDHKVKKARAKVDKQEVEIYQRMTVASLAEAMNRDTGEPG